ncbi:MAG: iron-containing alcohol dehydrogenase, partial [SAR202 cluster bacterium]|nr:iron-containing alcohol dehydrogenase [SAR202 cluster bacterium]
MTQQNILQGDFNPTVPTRIVFGNEKIDSLRDEVKKLGGKRVLVLSGRTVAEKTDSVRRINEGLGDLSAGVYSGLIQRAPLSTAIEAANMAVANGVDTLVGVGGSTISDAARMIAVLMAEGITTVDQLRQLGEDQDMVLEPNLDGKSLPLQVSIPTTLSAGEFNMGGGNVLDDQAGHKIRVRHPRLYADLIILDPVMTEGTPDWLWLSTGVKALDHCIERL